MRVVGWAAILAALAAEGWPMTRHAARRLARRRFAPLPVDGPMRRPFSTREAIAAWVTDERRREGRTDLGAQGARPARPAHPAQGARSAHNRPAES